MSAKKTKEKKKVGPLRVILRILGGVLAVLLLVLLVMFVIPLTETGDATPVEGSADWMSALDARLRLNEVVLPGTHDSATRYVQLGFFSKCQALGIAGQLEAGYRYLDIRLAADGEQLKLMHGFTNCRSGAMPWSPTLHLDEVLDDCYSFLGQHPTEFIVFAVKQEHGDESVADFERLLDSYVQKKPEFWLLTDSIPTVGEARGKLVLMRRYEDEAGLGSAAGIPLLWDNQNGFDNPALNIVSEDNGTYVLWVQDRYEYETADKWKAFTAGMEAAQKEENDLAIHFLSTKGTAKFGHPYRYAGPLNQKLMDRDALSGWIIVDFASAPIAEHIYQMNFR